MPAFSRKMKIVVCELMVTIKHLQNRFMTVKDTLRLSNRQLLNLHWRTALADVIKKRDEARKGGENVPPPGKKATVRTALAVTKALEMFVERGQYPLEQHMSLCAPLLDGALGVEFSAADPYEFDDWYYDGNPEAEILISEYIEDRVPKSTRNRKLSDELKRRREEDNDDANMDFDIDYYASTRAKSIFMYARHCLHDALVGQKKVKPTPLDDLDDVVGGLNA